MEGQVCAGVGSNGEGLGGRGAAHVVLWCQVARHWEGVLGGSGGGGVGAAVC